MIAAAYDNWIGLALACAGGRLPAARPGLPGALLMSWQAIVQFARAGRGARDRGAAARPLHGRGLRRRRRHGAWRSGLPAGRAAHLPGLRVDHEARAALERLRALAARVQPRLGARRSTLLQRLQGILPFNPTDRASVVADGSFNTAVSFVTNTNWQSYSGESTMSHLTQMAGLAVQNFVSAAAGMAVAVGADPRPHPPGTRDARQLLGRPDPHDRAHPAAARRSCSPSC